MKEVATAPVIVYTEATPNPDTLKFVTNRMLLTRGVADFQERESAGDSPLATSLFEFAGVRGVFVAGNFISVSKNSGDQWVELIPPLRDFIRKFLSEDRPLFTDGFEAGGQMANGPGSSPVEDRIVDILEKYVRPAVEMDGGAIHFKSFDEGKVTLTLKGACSGCPSSTVTLKAGIEGMLKRMVPEVSEVIAEEA